MSRRVTACSQCPAPGSPLCSALPPLLAASAARNKGLGPLADALLGGGKGGPGSPEAAARTFVRPPEVPTAAEALAGASAGPGGRGRCMASLEHVSRVCCECLPSVGPWQGTIEQLDCCSLLIRSLI